MARPAAACLQEGPLCDLTCSGGFLWFDFIRQLIALMRQCSSSVEGDAIKVYVRVRPPSEGPALTDGEQGLCLSVLSSNTIRLHLKPEPKIFTFDFVANMETTQVIISRVL